METIAVHSAHELILAPKDALDKNPQGFVGKIGIMLQSKDQHDAPQGKKVKVGDLAGVLVPEAPGSTPAPTPPAQEVTDPTTR